MKLLINHVYFGVKLMEILEKIENKLKYNVWIRSGSKENKIRI